MSGIVAKPVEFMSSVMKSGILSARKVERRRASLPPAGQPQGVQFKRETSIASVHFIDPEAPPERHMSDTPGMQYMEADVKERKVRSLRYKRGEDNPLLNKHIRLVPTPLRSSTAHIESASSYSIPQRVFPSTPSANACKDIPCSPISCDSGRSAASASGSKLGIFTEGKGETLSSNMGSSLRSGTVGLAEGEDATLASSFASTWKSGTIKSALAEELATGKLTTGQFNNQ